MGKKIINVEIERAKEIISEKYGIPKESIRLFRVKTGSDKKSYERFEEWIKDEYIAIDFDLRCDADDIKRICISDKNEAVGNVLEECYDGNGKRSDAEQIYEFVRAETKNTFVVAIKGLKQALGIAQITGDFYVQKFDNGEEKEYPNRRRVKWVHIFEENEISTGNLLEIGVGRSTFQQIQNPQNRQIFYSIIADTTELSMNNEGMDKKEEKQQVKAGSNRIFFGAPGTGKSFTLNCEKDTILGIKDKEYFERVTFHPEYTYANFVGTYKPISSGDGQIRYEYVPGPFMRIYAKACKNPDTNYLLIIEEINRANMAAVFGDIFQLLDRNDEGESEYAIAASEDIKGYLAKENVEETGMLKLPSNLFIWATMNSADQGVFPMDTAFKRRWDFTYIGVDDAEENDEVAKILNKPIESLNGTSWNTIRKAINDWMTDEGINEDKLMGPFFLSKKILSADDDGKTFKEAFKSKVLMYLFEDAAKQKRTKLFRSGEKMRYSVICDDFEEIGVNVFCQYIVDKVPSHSDNSDGDKQ